MRWLLSFTRITYLCKLIGILSFAAFLHLEIYRVYSLNPWIACSTKYLSDITAGTICYRWFYRCHLASTGSARC
ncbi:hypothetical protein CD201_07270 [Hafnia alvei]|nr:hypothetical protein CD201_07270 [Hafnia alvei]